VQTDSTTRKLSGGSASASFAIYGTKVRLRRARPHSDIMNKNKSKNKNKNKNKNKRTRTKEQEQERHQHALKPYLNEDAGLAGAAECERRLAVDVVAAGRLDVLAWRW
jgi:acetate kinase